MSQGSNLRSGVFGHALGFLNSFPFLTVAGHLYMAPTFHFFIFLSRVHQEEYVGVAASGCISHFTSCSAVFMIMRFPLRVVANWRS